MPTRQVDLHEAAAAEFDAAFDWYLQRSEDAAVEFAAEVDRAITQISAAPHRWAAGPLDTRRFLLGDIHFSWVYRERPSGSIQVLAIAHTSRKPQYWKGRIWGALIYRRFQENPSSCDPNHKIR